MDRGRISNGISDVVINNETGMDEAIQHLKELRHSKIGYIGGSVGLTISDHRVTAFFRALNRAGLAPRPEFIKVGDYRVAGGERAMKELLALHEWPTAVLTANDLTAIGALKAVRNYGYSVPRDVSIVGFDDIEMSSIVEPTLTTLRLPRQELAQVFYAALEFAKRDPHLPGRRPGKEQPPSDGNRPRLRPSAKQDVQQKTNQCNRKCEEIGLGRDSVNFTVSSLIGQPGQL
jgi:LacI family transcriptional regulator